MSTPPRPNSSTTGNRGRPQSAVDSTRRGSLNVHSVLDAFNNDTLQDLLDEGKDDKNLTLKGKGDPDTTKTGRKPRAAMSPVAGQRSATIEAFETEIAGEKKEDETAERSVKFEDASIYEGSQHDCLGLDLEAGVRTASGTSLAQTQFASSDVGNRSSDDSGGVIGTGGGIFNLTSDLSLAQVYLEYKQDLSSIAVDAEVEGDAEVATVMQSTGSGAKRRTERATSAPHETPPKGNKSPGKRRPHSALGRRLAAKDKAKRACTRPDPNRWRPPKKEASSWTVSKAKLETPSANKYDQYGFGMGDPLGRKDATQPNVMTPKISDINVSRKSEYKPSPDYTPQNFYERNLLQLARVPTSPAMKRKAAKEQADRRDEKIAAALRRKRNLEQEQREAQLKIVMERDSKYGGEVVAKLTQKFFFKGIQTVHSVHALAHALQHGRRLRARLNKGHVMVNVIIRAWRRYKRAKVAVQRRKYVYSLRAICFRIGIKWRIERKRRAARKVRYILRLFGQHWFLF